MKCPVPQCEKKIQDLNRHLQTVHQWHEIDAKAAKGKYGLRKLKDLETGRKRKNYTRKVCPIMTCQHTVVRLNNHLRQVHKIKDQRIIADLISESRRPSYEEIGKNEVGQNEIDKNAFGKNEIGRKEVNETNFDTEEDEEDLTQTSVEFSSTETVVMSAFIDWLQSIDGSHKREKDVKAQARHVVVIKRTIEEASADGSDDIRSVFRH